MELDLTRLNGLIDPAKNDGQEKKQASEKPVEQRTAGGEYKTTANPEKPVEDIVEGLQAIKILQREADAKKTGLRSISADMPRIPEKQAGKLTATSRDPKRGKSRRGYIQSILKGLQGYFPYDRYRTVLQTNRGGYTGSLWARAIRTTPATDRATASSETPTEA